MQSMFGLDKGNKCEQKLPHVAVSYGPSEALVSSVPISRLHRVSVYTTAHAQETPKSDGPIRRQHAHSRSAGHSHTETVLPHRIDITVLENSSRYHDSTVTQRNRYRITFSIDFSHSFVNRRPNRNWKILHN